MGKTLGIDIVYGTAGGTPATPLGGLASVDQLFNMVFDKFDKSRVNQAGLLKQWALTLIDAGTLNCVVAIEPGKLAELNALADGVDRAWGISYAADMEGETLVITGPLQRVGNTAGGTNTEILAQIEVLVNDIEIVGASS